MYILAGIMFPISCPHQSGGSGEPGNQSGGSGEPGNQSGGSGEPASSIWLFISDSNNLSQQHGFEERSKGQVTAKS